jgi:hypothetical protein
LSEPFGDIDELGDGWGLDILARTLVGHNGHRLRSAGEGFSGDGAEISGKGP